ncbi:MAG: glycoside hydrolase family 16 protein [Bacteroidales bacterium]|nr:glycoside hydrolase family 16 protein [Bacteroidales bacterium]
MNLLKTTLTAFVAAATLTAAAADSYHLFGYRLAWADEFDGPELDRSAWNVEINGTGCGNEELQFYVDSPDNVSLRDGNLVITARQQDYEDKHFTSARLNTWNKMTFTYGVIEARIMIPQTANGLWPAFWMMGNDLGENGWPACGETDILEMGHFNGIAAGQQDRLFNGALHWGTSADRHAQSVGDRVNPVSLQDGEYHTFYTVWTPEKIEMFVDDATEPYLSMDITERENPAAPGYYYHKPNFLLLNLAVGGCFPGILDPKDITALPDGKAEMLVDYVRVYQRSQDIASQNP